ncbi:MAG: DegT/DnrJ/EryC1/StrS family aminotransferase [Pseudolabrys sp.]
MTAPAIPIMRPWLGEAEADAARDVILSGWVMQGPKVGAFEHAFADYVGAPYACAVSSGTTALIVALQAVGVKPGDVVLTVSHSFIATANVVRLCGAEPVFVDIERDGYNIDPVALEDILTTRCRRDGDALIYNDTERLLALPESPLRHTKAPIGRVAAILAVHQMGFPCDIDAVAAIAKRHGVPWVEDAACAIGSEWRQRRIGAPVSDAACFSFHPRKLLTTGDGGMVTTASAAVDAVCRDLRQHAIKPPAAGELFESYTRTATNYRLTDIQAAIGLEQLKRVPAMVERRRALVARYRELLHSNAAFRILPEHPGGVGNWQSLPLDLGPSALSARDVIRALAAENIASKPGIMNAHQEAPYRGLWHLPESERRRDRTVLLPLYHDLADADIVRIATLLNRLAHHG